MVNTPPSSYYDASAEEVSQSSLELRFMVGEVAHDAIGFLTGIKSALDMLYRSCASSAADVNRLQKIERSADSLERLLRGVESALTQAIDTPESTPIEQLIRQIQEIQRSVSSAPAASSGGIASTPYSPDPASTSIAGPSRPKNILVVDDNLLFAEMLKMGFVRLGHRSKEISDPRNALELISSAPQDWDILITDESMPNLSGSALIRAVNQINPRIVCVICTGHAEFEPSGNVDLHIVKPIDVNNLADLAARLLEIHAEKASLTV